MISYALTNTDEHLVTNLKNHGEPLRINVSSANIVQLEMSYDVCILNISFRIVLFYSNIHVHLIL